MRITFVGFCLASLNAMTTYGVQLQDSTHELTRTQELMQSCNDFGVLIDALHGDYGCCGKIKPCCREESVEEKAERKRKEEEEKRRIQERLAQEAAKKVPDAVHYHIHPPGKCGPGQEAAKKKEEAAA